jgi:hypothetical protein
VRIFFYPVDCLDSVTVSFDVQAWPLSDISLKDMGKGISLQLAELWVVHLGVYFAEEEKKPDE